MHKKVYVANVPFKASEPELKTLSPKPGMSWLARLSSDRQTGRPKGIAFVRLSTSWEARRTVSMLNVQILWGRFCL